MLYINTRTSKLPEGKAKETENSINERHLKSKERKRFSLSKNYKGQAGSWES